MSATLNPNDKQWPPRCKTCGGQIQYNLLDERWGHYEVKVNNEHEAVV